jgi:hypothetical protein
LNTRGDLGEERRRREERRGRRKSENLFDLVLFDQ